MRLIFFSDLRLGDDLPDEVSREDIQQMLDKADVSCPGNNGWSPCNGKQGGGWFAIVYPEHQLAET